MIDTHKIIGVLNLFNLLHYFKLILLNFKETNRHRMSF
jgi:hypothetical protein